MPADDIRMGIIRRLSVIMLAAVAVFAGGCGEPTTADPFGSGGQVTQSTLDLRAADEADRITADAAAEAAAVAADLESSSANLDRAISRLHADSFDAAESLAAQFEADAATAADRLRRIEEKTRAEFATVKSRYTLASGDIARQRERIAAMTGLATDFAGSPLAQAAAGSVPGGALILPAITAALAWFGRGGIHKAADRGWDEKEAAAKAEALAAENRALVARLIGTAAPTPAPSGVAG